MSHRAVLNFSFRTPAVSYITVIMATRYQCQPWRPEYMTAPPSACYQLAGNVWGHTCSGTGRLPALSCYPWSASAPVIDERLFWSPAIACPQGWVAFTMRTTPYYPYATNGDAEWIAGETAITCCPSGFGGLYCRRNGANFQTNIPCVSGSSAVETGTMSRQGTSTTPTPYANELRLRYQQSDLTMPLPGTPTGSAVPTGRREDQGLSIGAKAAIGVVVPVVVIGLVVGVLLFWQSRKRRRNGERPKTQASTDATQSSKAELDAITSGQSQQRDGKNPPEVHQQSEARVNAAELEAGQAIGDVGRDARVFSDTSQNSTTPRVG
jgi:hypothetical protein